MVSFSSLARLPRESCSAMSPLSPHGAAGPGGREQTGRMSRRTARRAGVACLPLLLVVACAGSSAGSTTGKPGSVSRHTFTKPPASSAAAKTSFTTWPTYHRTAGRSGDTSGSVATPLHKAWSDGLDGAVYGEPILARGTLIVATENDTVY